MAGIICLWYYLLALITMGRLLYLVVLCLEEKVRKTTNGAFQGIYFQICVLMGTYLGMNTKYCSVYAHGKSIKYLQILGMHEQC